MIHETLRVSTEGRGLYEITPDITRVVAEAQVTHGVCHVFIHHTSASLIISENADPDVCEDLERFMARLAPDGDAIYAHTAEGPDDMPAHVRSVLTQTHLTMPVVDGRCDLGTWQGVYVWEHRHRAHTRRVTISLTV
ncbi:MAG: secondary thiamine-phosphate synthase enzyme YjbQ [Pseudomonadota bacterium]